MYSALTRAVDTLHKTNSVFLFSLLDICTFYQYCLPDKEELKGKGAKSCPTFSFPAISSLQHKWLANPGI